MMKRRALVAAAGLALIIGTALSPAISQTEASFVDNETATSTVSSGSMATPVVTSCSVTTHLVVLVGLVFKDLTLAWTSTHPPSQISLTATSQAGATSIINSSYITSSGPVGGVYSYSTTLSEGLLGSLLGNLLGGTTTFTLKSVVPGTSWASSSTTKQLKIALLGLNPTCT